MSSILDDIDNIINEGDSHVVKTKLFDRIVSHLSPYNKEHNTVIIDSYTINRKISNEIQALKYCGVRDLYKYFYLNETEIRQLCSDKNTVREVQNNSYSFCIRGNRGEYYNGHFRVNLDNSLALLTGGTIMIEMDDELAYFEDDYMYHVGKYMVDLLKTPPEVRDYVKKDIEKCIICFTEDFYKELKTYCDKKFGLL